LSYANYRDNNPYNDFVTVEPRPISQPAWGRQPQVSYENFYDSNPFNDYAVIVEPQVTEDWEEIEYRSYETVEYLN